MDDRTRLLLLLALVAVLVTLPFVRTTDTFYTSDANVYYHTAEQLVDEHRFAADEPHKGWIVLNGTYHPAMPVGYSLMAIPAGALTRSLAGEDDRIEIRDGISRASTGLFPGEKAYWVAEDASLVADISRDTPDDVFSLFLDVRSIGGDRELDVTLNNETVHTAVHDGEWTSIAIHGPVRDGRNTVRFTTPDGCEELATVFPFTADDRCASFTIRNIYTLVRPPVDPDVRTESGPILAGGDPVVAARIVNWNEYNISRRLGIDTWGYGNATRLTVQVVNGTPDPANLSEATVLEERTVTVPGEGRELVTRPLRLVPGNSTVIFRTNGTCSRVIGGRCVALGTRPVETLSPRAFRTGQVSYTGDWYLPETSGMRWMGDTASIVPRVAGSELVFEARSFHEPRNLTVSAADTTDTRTVGENWRTYRVPLDPGGVTFTADPGCRIPATVFPADDRRCISIATRNVRVD